MAVAEKMTLDEVYKYLRLLKPRYLKADRAAKSALLDEMAAVTGRHRKSLIRRLQVGLQRVSRQRERERTYKSDMDAALRVIWESYDCICAERLQPNLVALAAQLAQHSELELSASLQAQLGTIGLTTLRERLRQLRQDEPQLRRVPRPPNQSLADVPMRRLPWNTAVPGHFEVDLVWHCDNEARSEFGYTLQVIDICTGWSERIALLGRSYRVMEDGFRHLLARLPFPVLQMYLINNPGETPVRHQPLPKMPNTGTLCNLC